MASRVRVAGVALIGVLGLVGCAGVPTSGSVRVGRAVPPDTGLNEDDIQVLPAPPEAGMTPTALVTGFLRALVDSNNSYGVARTYLASGTTWRPSAGITTYDENDVSVHRTGRGSVSVAAPRVGTIDARGDFRAAGGTLRSRFAVVRQAGEWRISRLPAGVLLSTADTQRSLQPATVYYLDRQGTRLVPEQVLVHAGQPGLATTLVRLLLSGPGGSLARSVRSAVPAGTQLLGNVPVDDSGVAEVNLPGAVRQLPPVTLSRLSAQIVWTLRQLSEVTAVRLLTDGSPLSAPGVPSLQPRGSWAVFDPDGVPGARRRYVLHGGRVRGTDVPTALRLPGLAAATSSEDGTAVAALRRQAGRVELLAGDAADHMRRRLTATAITDPTFDAAGDVLAAVGPLGGQRLVVLPPSGGRATVAVPARLLAGGLQSVAVSSDGVRIAMVAGPTGHGRLLVGLLALTRNRLRVIDAHPALPGSQDVRGLSWASTGQVATTAAAPGGRRDVVVTDVDGYQSRALPTVGLPRRCVQVAVAVREPILASNGHGVWAESPRGTWHRVSTGHSPLYIR